MKLITFEHEGRTQAGVLDDGQVVALPFPDVGALLEVPGALESLDGGDATIPLEEVRLRAPLLRPPSIRDFSAFETHWRNAVRNQGFDELPALPQQPFFYFSNPATVLGPDDDVRKPAATSQLDYELELAAVIGREARDVAPEEALDAVAGFVLFNDWSARELCVAEFGGLGLHKGKDFAQGLGPWIVTPDELADRRVDGRLDLKMTARVNGEVWSDSTTRDMYWPIGELIAFASRDSRLVPGDVIGFGTVGWGCIFERPHELRWLEDGDVVELEGERLGTLRQTVRG
jgi:fumarylacetoacetate (FAA) hydrolase